MVERFVAHAPVTGPADQVTHNWSHRQFRELSDVLAELERKITTLAEFSLSSFVAAAYGSVRMSTAPQAGPDLGAGWQALDRMDQVAVTPRLMDVRSPGEFSVDHPGVYNLQTEVGFEHNSSNGGRFTQLRLFNVTDGVPTSLTTSIVIGRNVEVTQWTGNLLFEADDVAAQKYYRWEIGGGDAVSSMSWLTQSLSVNQLSEWRGPDLI